MKKMLLCIAIAVALAFGFAASTRAAAVSDVPDNHWAKTAVDKLLGLGLIEGYPDGTFKGAQPMSRYEYAVIVARMVDAFDRKFCTPETCKQPPVEVPKLDESKINEVRDLLNKLTEEYKYEIAALKVKSDELEKRMAELDAKAAARADEQDKRITAIEDRIQQPVVGIWTISGSLRQRVDAPDTDFSSEVLEGFFNTHYLGGNSGMGAPNRLKTGYEAYPVITLTGNVKPNATINLQFAKYLTNIANPSDTAADSALAIDFANLAVDLSSNVNELDKLSLTAGYQSLIAGPYGILFDNAGVMSNAALTLEAGKGNLYFMTTAGYADVNGQVDAGGSPIGGGTNIGAINSDLFFLSRIGFKTGVANLGLNLLSSGYGSEKGWSADIEAPILKGGPFLKNIRGEYAVLSETWDSSAWPATPEGDGKDYSYALFVDAYQTKKVKVTLGYADTPAVPALSSLDANPFTEADTVCPIGSDYPSNSGRPCFTSNYESGVMLFPGGFKGYGMEASVMVFGDVTVTGRLVSGDYAGGASYNPVNGARISGRGYDYPGYGSLSLTKPINESTSFMLEYMQQGMDPVILSRLRGEVLVNF